MNYSRCHHYALDILSCSCQPVFNQQLSINYSSVKVKRKIKNLLPIKCGALKFKQTFCLLFKKVGEKPLSRRFLTNKNCVVVCKVPYVKSNQPISNKTYVKHYPIVRHIIKQMPITFSNLCYVKLRYSVMKYFVLNIYYILIDLMKP